MTIAIVERPETDFATGDVMRTDTKYKGRFRTEDVGEPGGMLLTIGKLRGDVERLGKQKAPTKVQRVLVSKGDFTEVGGDLVPMSNQGERELNLLRTKYGRLIHVGGDYFVPQSEKERFEKLRYFENNPKKRTGGRNLAFRRGISQKHAQTLRNAGVPEGIVSKALAGIPLTEQEDKIVNRSGWVVVPGFEKPGTVGISGFIRRYRKTEKMVRAASRARGEWQRMTPRERAIAMPGGEV